MTRRTALFGAVGLGAAAAVAVPLAAEAGMLPTKRERAANSGAAAAAPASVPRRSTWLALIGTDLAVSGHAGVQRLRLSEVQDLPQVPSGDEDRYSLLFMTPVPIDGIVAFQGLAELYLSPVTQQQRTTAQAVIVRA